MALEFPLASIDHYRYFVWIRNTAWLGVISAGLPPHGRSCIACPRPHCRSGRAVHNRSILPRSTEPATPRQAARRRRALALPQQMPSTKPRAAQQEVEQQALHAPATKMAFSSELRSKILLLHELGWSCRQIGKHIGKRYTSVARFLRTSSATPNMAGKRQRLAAVCAQPATSISSSALS